MGNEQTKEEEKHETVVLRNPQVGEASPLYWACRGGDLDAVNEILSSTPFSDINRLEPNGSTALHAASFFGHTDVVRFLVQERGIIRHRKNRHGLTAYQEAPTKEIRRLFHRPSSVNRFVEENSDAPPQFIFTKDNKEEDEGEEEEDSPDGWVQGDNSTATTHT
ncbi:unnamed protein product [Didymodactylos carnosus]|uniref:Uncharacterized protein n=1 Tax=Didymodactylos carnosus TaxID=1234261 RepID=A0A815R6P3_9BILA|nr:unnamed protein product [Didymodactylos carnosus]CAF1471790.1 unnamed protein product [Didymodactylos carnosus]CAF4148355.1 unnamed protein product [Didymodactylos carnosus]CAF4339289.1 unnamed protein product [Didymodactylos carnosus]